jgi:hypothetical protein
VTFILSRLRKKGISTACSLTLVSSGGREVKESGHPFGCAQDKLLPRVRTSTASSTAERSFFRTLPGSTQTRAHLNFGSRRPEFRIICAATTKILTRSAANRFGLPNLHDAQAPACVASDLRDFLTGTLDASSSFGRRCRHESESLRNSGSGGLLDPAGDADEGAGA